MNSAFKKKTYHDCVILQELQPNHENLTTINKVKIMGKVHPITCHEGRGEVEV
jgi:hypothetical protein